MGASETDLSAIE